MQTRSQPQKVWVQNVFETLLLNLSLQESYQTESFSQKHSNYFGLGPVWAEIILLDCESCHKLVVIIQNYKAQATNQIKDQYLILGSLQF